MSHADYLTRAEALCRAHDAQLLFLSFFGSTLYGTALPGSDTDLRGLFLPSPAALALGAAPKHLRPDEPGDAANTVDDVDLGANRAVDYSLSQAKKYGAKGARLAVLREAETLASGLPEGDRLSPHIPALVAVCGDAQRCRPEVTGEGPALLLCGKIHLGSLRLGAFLQRVRSELARYGERAQAAAERGGVDCKALSHAARALFQGKELLQTGRIRFPLARAEELRAIKAGERPWPETGLFLERELAELAWLREQPHRATYDPGFARARVLASYDIPNERPDKAAAPSFPRVAPGFAVPDAARAAIMARLERAEAEHGVRILFACESGSRGWGFASADSDFDARFVYVRPRDRYLSLREGHDVLELGIEDSDAGVLDMNGWDLRKALRLFQGSNPVLAEWLDSPIVYVERGSLAARLRALAPRVVRPLAVWHHYRGLMMKSRATIRAGGGSLKTWFYLLRPLLAMQWLERGLGLPPMRFDRLMDGIVEVPDLRAELDALVEQKRAGAERNACAPSERLIRWVESLMPEDGAQPNLPPLPPASPPARLADLDALFRDILRETC